VYNGLYCTLVESVKNRKAGLMYLQLLTAAAMFLGLSWAHAGSDDRSHRDEIPNLRPFPDPRGDFRTYTTAGAIHESNPFFQNLGTNGRRCVTCHDAADAWTVTPPHIRQRFNESAGTDPIFRLVDGATCPTDDVSTIRAKREAYQLVLTKGLIRVSVAVPENAEFTITSVENPYGCNDPSSPSMYRRPLPSTNLGFLSTVMWDGREFPFVGEPKPFTESEIQAALRQQAIDATRIHAQGTQVPTNDQLDQIVAFETSLFTAQSLDNEAGSLHHDGATGGPVALSQQSFFLGINDPLGGNPTAAPFSSVIFTLFQKWQTDPDRDDYGYAQARASIARGEDIFNNRPITITGVGGLNDVPLQDGQIHTSITGFCGTCHSTPGAGDHSLPAPLNIGIADASRRTPDMPLFTIMCNSGTLVQTTGPGRALVSGKCADIGKFKGPILRGLGARAPYFHNGMAANLDDAVTFYQT
jgi:cytochrome c peroxidase